MKVQLAVLAVGATLMTKPVHSQPVPTPAQGDAARPLSAATNRAVAERAASLLKERYVTPALGARYARALRAHAQRGDYVGYVDRRSLAERLTADLQAVAPDGHLRFYPIQPAPPVASPVTAPAETRPSGSRAVPEEGPSIAPGIRAIRWIAPGVAYISFEHFDDRPEAMAAMRRFLADYASAKALVLDSRGNHGGAFDMMGLLANHLFARERLLANMDMATSVVAEHGAPFPVDGAILRRRPGPAGMTRFQHWAMPVPGDRRWSRMPVYYLTSRRTFSAAEHLAMVLKTTGRAMLIGEVTGGGNHFGGTEPVGGDLELYVPVGRTTDPATGRDWEGSGIAPDHAMPAGDALDEALRRIGAGN